MAQRQHQQRNLSGPERAVIVLLSIDDEVATEILKHLESSDLTKISNYVNLLDEVPREKVDQVKQQFGLTLAEKTGSLGGASRTRMKSLMEKSVSKDKLADALEVLDSGDSSIGLETLKWLDPHSIASFLRGEHPQTVALILAHLEPAQSAQVLGLLSESLQSDIMMRIANLERISPDVIRELNEILAKELTASGAARNQRVGGIEAVSEIFNSLDKTTEGKIIGKIEEVNPGLAENIRELMFVFEDLQRIDNRGMQSIMKEVSNDVLTLALKTASPAMREKMFESVSSGAAKMIQEELEVMGPVKLSDVEDAQNEIVKIARRLEEEGKIVLAGKGGGDQLV